MLSYSESNRDCCGKRLIRFFRCGDREDGLKKFKKVFERRFAKNSENVIDRERGYRFEEIIGTTRKSLVGLKRRSVSAGYIGSFKSGAANGGASASKNTTDTRISSTLKFNISLLEKEHTEMPLNGPREGSVALSSNRVCKDVPSLLLETRASNAA